MCCIENVGVAFENAGIFFLFKFQPGIFYLTCGIQQWEEVRKVRSDVVEDNCRNLWDPIH